MNEYRRTCATGSTLRPLGFVLGISFCALALAHADPTIVSTVPANMAGGVSTTAGVVFTFSEAMNPAADVTYATFSSFIPPATLKDYPVQSTWSAGNTVLTCTPINPFDPNTRIIWNVVGESAGGVSLSGETAGLFTTGTGGGGSSNGTNALTSFVVGKIWYYNQTNSSGPVLDELSPYGFTANTSMASNRPATSVQLSLPTGVIINLTQTSEPWSFYFVDFSTNLTTFNATYPVGNYGFTAKGSPDLSVSIALLAENQQPNAPKILSYDALQAVDPAQAVTISWAPFENGAAKDFIHVEVWKTSGFSQTNVFSTPDYGQTNALTGTATSVQIPSGRLEAGQEYQLGVLFNRINFTTNQASAYATGSYRSSFTASKLVTSSGSGGGNIQMSAPSWDGTSIVFDVEAPAGKNLFIEYTGGLGTPWQTLYTTNSLAGKIQVKDTPPNTLGGRFYRVRAAQ